MEKYKRKSICMNLIKENSMYCCRSTKYSTVALKQPNHIKIEIVYTEQTFWEQDKIKKPLNISRCIWNPGSPYWNAIHISKGKRVNYCCLLTQKLAFTVFSYETVHRKCWTTKKKIQEKRQKNIFEHSFAVNSQTNRANLSCWSDY